MAKDYKLIKYIMKLEYTIPKIHGKELTWEQAAILMGYEPMVESQPKTTAFVDDAQASNFMAQTLTATVDREKGVIVYTELEPNTISPEAYVNLGFQNIIKEFILGKIKESNAQVVAQELEA